MITLNSEQGFIHIENWEQITSNAGYRADLNPAEHTLDSIIGRYVEKEMVRCGLTNCHTPHAKGYVVKTKSGLSTNIGHDCGKKYFGVDFEVMAKKFEHDFTMQTNRELLSSFSMQLEEFEQNINNMRTGNGIKGADWIYKRSRHLVSVNGECPNEIVAIVNSMVKSSDNLLSKSREATKDEIDTAETIKGGKVQRPYFIEEPVAEILGLQALKTEYDLRALFVLDIEININTFKQLNIDQLNYEALRHWSKWISSLDNKIEVAWATIKAGNELLTRANLQPFNTVITSNDSEKLFKAYLRTLD